MTLDWPLSPGLLSGVVIVAVCYVRGWLEQRGSAGAVSVWRHAGFFAGLAALLIALQSPLDILADHSFTLHQFQHLFLRAIGPLLLMLSIPQALLIAGMPEKLRIGGLAPLLASRAAGAVFGFFSHPFVATFLLLAVPVFWHLPGFHDLSVRNATVHAIMHATMFASGMFFFWRVLDPRPAPQGASYGTRIVMSWAAIAGNIPLGAYMTLKSAVLYPVYGENGRALDLSAMADEQLGGVVIWSPGSMVFGVLLVVVIRFWGMQEQQQNRHGQYEAAIDAKVSLAMANRRMGWRLAAIAATVGAGVAMVAVLRQFLP